MKKAKHISLLLTAALTVTLPLAAYAPVCSAEEESSTDESSVETFTCGDYEYALNDDDTATLTRYSGTDTAIEIPADVDGHDVTILGGGIFANKPDITSIAIPETLTELKDSCFFGCTALETFTVDADNEDFQVVDDVLFSADGSYLYCYPTAKTDTSYTVPDGVVEIWSSAFANTALTEISFPNSLLYVDDWTFSYSQLTELNLPDSVVEIGGYAFSYCTRLTEVDLPADLEIIDAAAFSCNPNLTKVTLPDGLQTIQMAAFAGTGLTEVTIPASVTYIGFCAFGYEEDMETTVDNFVIYGEVGSQAEVYCTDSDEENSYENHFTFCSVLSSEDSDSSEEDSDAAVQVTPKEKSSFQSAFKWILLGLGALVLLIGGVVLLLSGKSKKTPKAKADTPESETDTESESKQDV